MIDPAEVRVPEGHEVRVVGGSFAPCVHRPNGGMLMASTGAAGDDHLAEVPELLSELERLVSPCEVIMTTELGQLSDLLAPACPPTVTLVSAAVVLFQKGTLAGWAGEDLSELAIRLRTLAQRTNLFVCVEPSPELRRVKLRFESAGLRLLMPTPDGAVVLEVHRPDGMIITGLVGAPLDVHALEEVATTDTVLKRSPRLNALLLAHVREESARTRRAVEQCLETRSAPLVLMARQGGDGEYGIAPRSFGGKEMFVAYGDDRALHGAAHVLALDSYAIAAMPPRKLFAWAASLSTPLLLCAYENPSDLTSQAWHIPFEVEDLRRLAEESS